VSGSGRPEAVAVDAAGPRLGLVATSRSRAALDERTPVGNGVLTCDTVEQAADRSGGPGSREHRGWEATVAALDAAVVLAGVRHRHARPES